MTTWSPQQEMALKSVNTWLKNPGNQQVFRLFGYAGTGKTTLARHLAEGIDGEVCFGAFTGKAALVMRMKGCPDASTIHSMIYKVKEDADGYTRFVLNRSGPVKHADLVVIDECSMVDEKLGRDLLSFGKPVLVIGDPAQLPPVKGQGFFTNSKPDVLLTEVHRQAQDNPIIHLAMTVREGRKLDPGTYGESRVIARGDIDSDEVLKADQVLVGLNRTRQLYNRRIRELLGRKSDRPVKDDRLVCLRNNHEKGILNGGIWTVIKLRDVEGDLLSLRVKSLDSDDIKPVNIKVFRHFFQGTENELEYADRRSTDEFTFGYALTTHKAQGSQWDNVLIFDEAETFREDANRWRYTALTRGAQKVTVVQ